MTSGDAEGGEALPGGGMRGNLLRVEIYSHEDGRQGDYSPLERVVDWVGALPGLEGDALGGDGVAWGKVLLEKAEIALVAGEGEEQVNAIWVHLVDFDGGWRVVRFAARRVWGEW